MEHHTIQKLHDSEIQVFVVFSSIGSEKPSFMTTLSIFSVWTEITQGWCVPQAGRHFTGSMLSKPLQRWSHFLLQRIQITAPTLRLMGIKSSPGSGTMAPISSQSEPCRPLRSVRCITRSHQVNAENPPHTPAANGLFGWAFGFLCMCESGGLLGSSGLIDDYCV